MGRLKEEPRGRLATLQDILADGGKRLVDQAQGLRVGLERRIVEVGRGVEGQVVALVGAAEERLTERLDALLNRLSVSLRKDGVRELVAPIQAVATGAGERASGALARAEELAARFQNVERRIAELTR